MAGESEHREQLNDDSQLATVATSGQHGMSIALVRDPFERYASSFRSKVSCEMCDECHNNSTQPRDRIEMRQRVTHFVKQASGEDFVGWCLDLERFTKYLQMALDKPKVARSVPKI